MAWTTTRGAGENAGGSPVASTRLTVAASDLRPQGGGDRSRGFAHGSPRAGTG